MTQILQVTQIITIRNIVYLDHLLFALFLITLFLHWKNRSITQNCLVRACRNLIWYDTGYLNSRLSMAVSHGFFVEYKLALALRHTDKLIKFHDLA